MANDKELKDIVADQQEQIEALKKLVQDQSAAIEKLTPESATPKEEVKLETPKETFKVNGKDYRFKVPKYIVPGEGGGPRLSKDSLKDPAELERLVTIKSGVVELAK